MLQKIKKFTGSCKKKITVFLLQKEIKEMKKSTYLTLADRVELNRDMILLSDITHIQQAQTF